jgi:hypothetical protein
VAPHAAKIHTLITLGVSIRAKPPVLKAQIDFPVGSWGQHIDPVGRPWEQTLIRRRSRAFVCPYEARAFIRTVTRCEFEKSSKPASLVHSHLLDRFGFDGPRDPHRNYRDIGDPFVFHPAELAVPTGRHCARNTGGCLNELRCFHDEFPVIGYDALLVQANVILM